MDNSASIGYHTAMKIRLNQLRVKLDHTPADLQTAVTKTLGSRAGGFEILRRSVDARSRTLPPAWIYQLEVDVTDDFDLSLVKTATLAPDPLEAYTLATIAPSKRPVIVGAGPAGLLAALTLAEAGAKPLLVERGESTDDRSRKVAKFWNAGALDTESNALYGEGGAGLFSDGKLTARSKDRKRIRRLFEVLIECGAPKEILTEADPHIGTDVLRKVIPTLRERIQQLGGEVRFSARLDCVIVDDGRLVGLQVNGEEIDADCCILAAGHSARDVYTMLHDCGVALEAKPFAVGVRAEMPQDQIAMSQYGRSWENPALPVANFRMTRREEKATRACYSFCMCPGGEVIACTATEGEITTNGMSHHARNSGWGNAAFLVPVTVEDYAKYASAAVPAELAGIEFQRNMEQRAFKAAGENYALPVQRMSEFLAGEGASDLPRERSCTRAAAANLRDILPGFVVGTLQATLSKMLRGLRGVRFEDVLLYGAETRSSAPVRVLRDEIGQSTTASGLFPCGEGSGYAGGIVSSAIDGMKAAEAFIQTQAE
jgi:uncharacterized FAD-dependent dehydrogenase